MRRLALFAAYMAITLLRPGPAQAADAAAVARIHGGIVDCVACDLRGAALMCMSFANFTNASFRGTELSGANLAGAKLDGADLTGAKTSITSFLGTDLRHVKGLTQAQLDIACGDDKTLLPPGLKIHTCK